MSETATIYQCESCDYKSKVKCNVLRHMVTKHSISTTENNNTTTENNNNTTENNNNTAENNNNSADNNNNNPNPKQCIKCDHVFTRRNDMLKHYEKCRGKIDKLQCRYCLKKYGSVFSKNNHQASCRVRKELEAINIPTPIIAPSPIPIPIPSPSPSENNVPVINNINNTNNTVNNTTNNTINNTVNNTINNITNNNIIVYKPYEPYLYDHIDKKVLRKILKLNDLGDVVTEMGKEVFKRKENQCIRNTNLRSSTSSVHVGNDKWEIRTDKQIYPHAISNIILTIGESSDSYNLAIQDHHKQHSEDFTCNGVHCNSKDREETVFVKKMYKETIDSIKGIIYDNTTDVEKTKAL